MSLRSTLAAFASVLALASCAGPSATTSANAAVADGPAQGEWVTWGGDPEFTRYSPLDQINASNVKTLEIAWRYKALPLGTRADPNTNATPLYVDGLMYIPTGVNQVVALNPKTGQEVWRFNPAPDDISGRPAGLRSRAVAWWSDGAKKRILHNAPDGRLISIDALTGKADPAFGTNGYILLKDELRADGLEVESVGSTSPPTIVGDVVVVSVIPAVYSPNKEATPGYIRGYDVHTGRKLWTFHTIPRAGEFGNETWENESWTYTGNTGVWSMMSADPELGYVYLPVETPTHDFYGGQRKGDNLFAESVVALDAKTGKRVWHYQLVHHGVWDYDPPSAPILHDIVKDGKRIKALTQLTKQGWAFVFDRVTGEPVWPIEERPVPQNGVPGEKLSPTQPHPTRPAPYISQGYSEDSLIDFTPELREEAKRIASNYVLGPIYTPPTEAVPGGKQGTWLQPGYGGGGSWNGGGVDKETNMLFVPMRSTILAAVLTKGDPKITNWEYVAPSVSRIPLPSGLPMLKPPYSTITGTDMNKGEHIWRQPIGGAPDFIRNHPKLKNLEINFDIMGKTDVRPSPLVTKSLLFLGESGNLSGDPGGPMFRAYDKATGEVLAEIELPERTSAAPMTYMHEGKQFIVIAVATRDHPSEFVALTLPDGKIPTVKSKFEGSTAAAPAPAAIPLVGTPQEIARGRQVYATSCAACHGPNGEGLPAGPPRLTGLRDMGTIRQIVERGGAQMPPMGALLPPSDIDAVTKFVASGLPR